MKKTLLLGLLLTTFSFSQKTFPPKIIEIKKSNCSNYFLQEFNKNIQFNIDKLEIPTNTKKNKFNISIALNSNLLNFLLKKEFGTANRVLSKKDISSLNKLVTNKLFDKFCKLGLSVEKISLLDKMVEESELEYVKELVSLSPYAEINNNFVMKQYKAVYSFDISEKEIVNNNKDFNSELKFKVNKILRNMTKKEKSELLKFLRVNHKSVLLFNTALSKSI